MPKITKMYNPKGTTHHKRGGGPPGVAKKYSPPKSAGRVQPSKGNSKSKRKY